MADVEAFSDRQASDETDQTKPCLNCDTPLTGAFCYHCGQEAIVERFTLKSLLAGIRQSLQKVDTEYRKTFTSLLRQPGEFCRQYLEGKRKHFAAPAKYFLFSFVLQLTVFGMVRYLSHDPEIDDLATASTSFQLFTMGITVFWAVGYTIAFRRSGYNFAENAVCLLFLGGEVRIFSLIIQLVFLPLALIFGSAKLIAAAVELTLTIIYYIYFSKQFYKESLVSVALKNVIVTLIFSVILISILMSAIVLKAWITHLIR